MIYMKKATIIITLITSSISLFAQELNDFEIFLRIETTPLKDQQSSGTCWSFASTSFIETEALRLGHDHVPISPIFYVHPTYLLKAEKFITTKGETYFGAGDLTFSVMEAYKNYGAIPESVYNGIIEGDWQHDHLEMDNLLYSMVESIGKSGYGRIKPNSWKKSVEAVLKAYLGCPPATFIFDNKLYSPQSFAKEHIGIDPNNYIEITSYDHIDFYKMSELNIPANWNNHKYLNLPIEDFCKTIDNALKNGFSLAWDGDATEAGFDFEKGVAKLSNEQESTRITQKLRQVTFEDNTTTDDHNMHIIGKAKDNANNTYYMLKNSEGSNQMNGYIFMTSNAMKLKTISVLVHKDAIPHTIAEKCTWNF